MADGVLEVVAVTDVVHLAAALPNAMHVENIFGLNLFDFGATSAPLPISGGKHQLSDAPGHGVRFEKDALQAHKLIPGSTVDRKPLYHFSS